MTGARVGLQTGGPGPDSFEAVFQAFERQLRHLVDVKVRGSNVIEQLYAARMPAPFLSTIIDDCIGNGIDYNAGGARYNTTYIMPVGIGTVTDSLSAIRHHVFDGGTVDLARLARALRTNFAGEEPLRQSLWNRTPRYGNDDPAVDGILAAVFDAVFAALDGRPNPRGGLYHVNYLSTTCHVYFGSKTGPRPTAGGHWSRSRKGSPRCRAPIGRVRPRCCVSASRLDHARTGGTLLNQKFSPDALQTDSDLQRLAALVRGYFALGGHHIQFNVVTAATLRDAQAHPERHRDLIVRVAGYSDYFCDLTRALQDEIISRTEHSVV